MMQKVRSLFYFQLRSGLVFLLVSALAYHFSEQRLLETVENNLQAHASFREGRIHAFIEAQKRWITTVVEDQRVVGRVSELMALYSEQGTASGLFQHLSREFSSESGVLARSGGTDQLFLFSPQGELVFTLNAASEDIGDDFTSAGLYGNTLFSQVVEQVMTRTALATSDYGYLDLLGRSTILMGAPILGEASVGEAPPVIGILVRPLALEWLREMLAEYTGLGRTGDVFIAQRLHNLGRGTQINFINLLRNGDQRDEACTTLQREQPELFPVLRLANATETLTESGWAMDPQCHEVFAVWSWIPELNWGMVVKQDREEVLEPIEGLQQEIGIALFFSIMVLVWLLQHQARSMAQPIEALTAAAQQDRIEQYPAGKVREINQLAQAMRALVDSLHQHEAALEQTVQLRTRELTQEKEFIEYILDSIHEGVVVLDTQGKVVRANRVMADLMGGGGTFSMEQLEEGRSVKSGSMEGALHANTGERIPVLISQLKLEHESADESQAGVTLMLFHDLRARIRIGEQEQYLAFQSGVAEMSATLLHNVGNAITGINGNLNRLEQWIAQMQRLEQMLQNLSKQTAAEKLTYAQCSDGFRLSAEVIDSQGLSKIVSDLQEGAGRIGGIIRAHRATDLQKVSAATFNICPMLEDTVMLLRDDFASAGVVLQTSCEEELSLTMPRNQMIQMVLNLLKNALQAVQAHQRIERSLSGKVNLDVICVGNHEVVLTVRDNGVGIALERQRDIFVCQYDVESGTSRYGLHSVANFVRSVGGRIELESDGHLQGASFKVILPMSVEGAAQERAAV